MHPGSVNADSAKWRVTQGMLEREIDKVRKAKAEHSGGGRGRAGGWLGFTASKIGPGCGAGTGCKGAEG
jgi:hypothetical protein